MNFGRPSGQSQWLNSYRTTLSRARRAGATSLFKEKSNDYEEVDKVFADGGWQLMQWDGGHVGYLNEDDYDFIGRVRQTGSATCEMWTPHSHRSPAEEIEFWLHPWCSEETGVPRQNWQPTYARKLREQQDERALELLKARRAERKIERKIEARTMERENKRYIKEQARIAEERERRVLRTMLADIEWERSQPKSGWDKDRETIHGRGVRIRSSRFYVPYWLREEIAIDEAWGPAHEENEWFDRKAAAKAARAARKQAAKEAAAHTAEIRKYHDARTHVDEWANECKRIAQHIAEAQRRGAAERAESERRRIENERAKQIERANAEHLAAWRQASRAAAEHDRMIQEARERAEVALADSRRRGEAEKQRLLYREVIKGRILSTIRGTGTTQWTPHMLVQATGASEADVISCASELAGEGYIHAGPVR